MLLIDRINAAIGGFIRGQLKLCLAVGLLVWLSLQFIAHLDYAIIMGLIAAATEFIPYIGPILGMLMPLGVAFFTGGVDKMLLVFGIFMVIQLLENNLLAPRIMGDDIGMHPVVVIFIFLAAGEVAGIPGMIVCLPVAVIIKVFYEHFYIERFIGRHDLYENEPELAAAHAGNHTPPPTPDAPAHADD
jgi:predicted PurR-regulated permease PerM